MPRTDETFMPFREAEIKHGRLAMLAAVAWPLQEIFHPLLVDAARETNALAPFFVRDVLAETAGKSPSLLNGGLEQIEVVPALSLAVFAASVLELRDVKVRREMGLGFNEYKKSARMPGDVAFDPLNISRSLPEKDRIEFMEKELLNGRLAMIAVTSYVLVEAVFDMPVVRFTPDLFERAYTGFQPPRPLPRALPCVTLALPLPLAALFLAPDFRAALDAAFSSASMDGSIDGVAY